MENKRDLYAWKPSCVASYSEELPRWCASEKRVGDHVGTKPPILAFATEIAEHLTFPL